VVRAGPGGEPFALCTRDCRLILQREQPGPGAAVAVMTPWGHLPGWVACETEPAEDALTAHCRPISE
jgi:hypothetical protein